MRASGYPIIVNGDVAQLAGIFQDVTQNELDKEAIRREQMFSQQTISSMSDGFIVINPQRVIINVNDSICEMTGYSRDEFIGSIPPFPHWPKTGCTDQMSFFAKLLEKGVASAELTLEKKNGEIIPVYVTANSVKDSDGLPVLYFGTFKDISDRKEAEQELERIHHITKEQNERLNNFTHIVSHNLRTNAGNVQSLINLVLEENPALKNDEMITMAMGASDKLMQTIDSLSQLLITKAVLITTAIDLKLVIDRAIENSFSLIQGGKIKVLNHVQSDHVVLGIPAYIESIVMNFLTNGIRYRDQQKDSFLTFSAYNEGEYAVLTIEDNGLGIDLTKHGDNLFGMFKTFHNHPDSLGVGLHITKNQVDALGGKIEVESEIGIGTTFRVFLKRDLS